jgi:transcription initiation factor TFIID subunit 6
MSSPFSSSPSLSRSTILSIVDSLGQSVTLSTSVQDFLVRQLEVKLRDLIDSSVQFMRQSQRHQLTITDLNLALKTRNCESIYGYTYSSSESAAKSSDSLDLPMCLLPMDDFFLAPTRVLTLDEIFTRDKQINKQKIPKEPKIQIEWLAVEGKRVGKQQTMQQIEQQVSEQLENSSKLRKIQKEIELAQKSRTGTGSGVGVGLGFSGNFVVPPPPVNISPALTVLLSPEHQVFFERVLTALLGPDNRLKSAALQAVQLDDGIHQLVPHFSQWIADQTLAHIHSISALRSILQLSHSLLLSHHLHLEPYLHQLLPALLTCLVGKKIGSPMADHWTLRDEAAALLGKIAQKFSFFYVGLVPRIAKTLITALIDVQKPLTTHCCLTLLYPIMADQSKPQSVQEATLVFHALLNAAAAAAREEIQYKREIRLAVLGNRNEQQNGEEKEEEDTAMEVETKKAKIEKSKQNGQSKLMKGNVVNQEEISINVAESLVSNPSTSISHLLDLFGDSLLPRIIHESDWTPGPFGHWNPSLVDYGKPVPNELTELPAHNRIRQTEKVSYDLASMFL